MPERALQGVADIVAPGQQRPQRDALEREMAPWLVRPPTVAVAGPPVNT